MKNFIVLLFSFVVTLILFTGCNNSSQVITQTPSPVIETETIEITKNSEVPPTVTPTPEPTAAIVNGERIYLADFEEEFLRYKDAIQKSGLELDEEIGRATVLENMIDVLLLAQSARENGFQLTNEIYQARYEKLLIELGEESNFQNWVETNHYSAESFERFYKLEIEAAFMRDKILDSVPKNADQIRARQIMVQSKTMAEEIYAQLQSGADFATLAWIYDPITGGELSWFPRNYLVIKEVEDSVFSLNVGEYSQIIATDYGYQIVQVIESEKGRALTQDALLAFQRTALDNWIQERKQNSAISVEVN